MIPVAVLDTNILVSAALSGFGNEAGLFRAAENDRLRFVWSNLIEAEYRSVLYRKKFGHVRVNIDSILVALQIYGHCVETDVSSLTSPDPSDVIFIDCAVAAGAQFLVTGNKQHFPEQFYGRTEVVNARQLLDRIASTTP